MIETGFDRRIKIQEIVRNQIPEFLLSESPKTEEFLKQYYISQEFQGGAVDIAENLDEYLKIDNLTPEIISGKATLTNSISQSSDIISVDSTKGFPPEYGLLKIDNEIITYTGLTTNTFTGCVRGFSGITSYHQVNNPDELIFSSSSTETHTNGAEVTNLSSLFLQEFYNKIKYTFVPGLENINFTPNLNVSNFVKEARSLYQSKGTEESFKILFKVLYNENVTVIDLENLLIKPSAANFSRRENLIVERISGDPLQLVGQTIRKSTDSKTQGSVSEVEIINRSGKIYYKISLFIGFNENELSEGVFSITGNSKVLENVSIGASIISVDSTIGFGQTGTLISGSNVISYTDKSVNQFFGCSGVESPISSTSVIRSSEYVYGYENGDINKKVELRITGVLSKFLPIGDISLASEKQVIGIKNLGESIKNPDTDKTYKEIFANSWIYNTSSRYQIGTISGSTFTLLSDIDKSSLKVGDKVDILVRGGQTVAVSNVAVTSVNNLTRQVILTGLGTFVPSPSFEYDLRRRIEKVSSTGAAIEFGNNNLIANVQNLYTNEDYGYVASNSLPSYTITKNVSDATISEANGSRLQGLNSTTLKYSIISFPTNVPFINGDEVIYLPEKTSIPELVSGTSYYVQVLTSLNQIRLYTSKSFIGYPEYIEFSDLPAGTGSHRFLLARHRDLLIAPQKILRKFSLKKNYDTGFGDKTESGPVGLLINGVEIISPRSEDKIYHGPLETIKIINGGSGYDVINPPFINISSPSIGSTAFVRPVIRGSVQEVLVDPQDFDIQSAISATITGGNGSGVILKPVVSKKFRELEFDARESIYGGGLDISNETISFPQKHNLVSGQSIIYSNNGNPSLGIGTFGPPDLTNNRFFKTLVSGSEYYVKVVNTSSIQLYQTLNDYVTGINTVGFTTENTSGIHKFRTLEKKTLSAIKVLNSGSGYENRHLYVKPSGISSERSCVIFKNHNFNDGDLINYSISAGVGTDTPVSISGLSTANSYYVLKLDNDSFRLANAGIGGSITSNYERKKYATFSSSGFGYQIFKYPDIQINVNVSYGSTIVGIITATPIIKGQIIDAYLYESGTGYGSNIVNFVKKPIISIKNGRNAEVAPIIKNGRIIEARILSGGTEYYSIPELRINGNGSGAVLRPVVSNGKLVDIVVINRGVNYDSNTTINVVPSGSGAKIDCSVRDLTINEFDRFSSEILVDGNNKLEYSVVGYSTERFFSAFNDNGIVHSPIIGWAYDGNPIYGPFGYSDPEDIASPIKHIKPGYILDVTQVENRPSEFSPGFFVDDYVYNDSGDLDVHNGRFCKTPEFQDGTYAYFVGINTDITTNTLQPSYPYFVGESYRSPLERENFTLNQKFDFNNSGLSRNTFPYKVGEVYADNDFLTESNEIIKQQTVIENITRGSVDSLEIEQAGGGYKVGDRLLFNDAGTDGGGLSAEVSEVEGKEIVSVDTQVETYNNSVFVWKDKKTVVAHTNPYHTISDQEYATVSGLSSSITKLIKSHKVGVTTGRITLFKDMTSVPSPGTVEDIYVSHIPSLISIGSTLQIENEPLQVLNIFNEGSILRVRRSDTGVAHTSSTFINILPNKIEIPIQLNYFDSNANDVVYFNPKQSVGVGTTTGGSSIVSNTVGEVQRNVSVPNQSIYLPNHPFKTGQQVTFAKKTALVSSLICSDTPDGSTFFVPNSGLSQTVYIINKSKDYIGITTVVGFTTNTGGLYFSNNGTDNYEYSFSSNFSQVTGKVQKIKTTVSVSTVHNLQTGDVVRLDVKPNTAAGIGNSSSVRVYYNQKYDRILINTVGFNSTGINTSNSSINVDATYLKTGDKVFYNSTDSVASGLDVGMYYVYKIDDSTIKLTETFSDTLSQYPRTVTIVGTGGTSHQISLVNPEIEITKNSDLVFDTSDSSLIGKELRIFYDSQNNNEFISVGNTSIFNVSGFGTVGVSTNSTLTLKYSDGLPTKLYYALETSGYISTSDTEVKNYSLISFKDSAYTDSYVVSGIGSTTFSFALNKNPEKNTLLPSENDVLKYYTTSGTANGGISKVKTIFTGYNYKKLPIFVGSASTSGSNANIIPQSTTIGKINKTRILNSGFEYSSDKTLRPEADISPIFVIKNSNTFTNVSVIDGGKNYSSPPNLLIVDPLTNRVVNSDSLTCNLSSSSISSVNINVQPYGLNSTKQRIVAINNSNGVAISSISSSPAGIVTCVLATPIVSGFSTNVFNVGEEIFVEGIQKEGTDGTGFNSTDYGFRFFTVTSYQNTNPAIVEFNLTGIATNAGLAKTNQLSYASIIAKKNYPIFETNQTFSYFDIEEKLLVNSGNGFIERELYVLETTNNYIKVRGTYSLRVNDIVKGKNSGVLATIDSIIPNKGQFIIDYSTRQDNGWITDTGKLNETYQVTSDNDYYQNLSYTVKSSIEYDTLVNPVNRLLHTSGLKNFADTQILSKQDRVVSYASTTNDFIVLDISDEKRVDTINNYDLTLDVNTFNGKSKFLKLKNKKLTNYIKCITNRAINIDDISRRFSNSESNENNYVDIDIIDDTYSKYLIQVVDPNTLDRQLSEVVIIRDEENTYTLEKSFISNTSSPLGILEGNSDGAASVKTLRFTPTDPFDTDYDIKFIKTYFNSTIGGIGTQSLGFIDLTGLNASVGVGTTVNIISVDKDKFDSLYANIELRSGSTGKVQYVELFLTHDHLDTYQADFYFDSTAIQGISTNYVGSFQPSLNSNILSLDYYNTGNNIITVRSKIVGFGTTSVGVGTYRFLATSQPEGSERSARFESNYTVSSGTTSIIGISTDTTSSLKSLVKVSYGNTSAIHQVLLIHDNDNVYTVQGPFLSIGSTSGIGTFGGSLVGQNAFLEFYPDPSISSDVQIQSLNEIVYFENDYNNVTEDLEYGTISENVLLSAYDALNGDRFNKTDFDLLHEGRPIYRKTFNPSISSILNPVSGTFTIIDHLLNTGEELTYNPGSTFVGVAASAVGIGLTADYVGVVTDILPSKVYAIKIDNDNFKISTRQEYANAGIYVTFTSTGSGNAHTFDMTKKLEKTILSLNGVVQKPISFVPISYQLENNSGQISAGSTYFALSGISTLKPKDLVKIDDEYIEVLGVGVGTTVSGPITGIGTYFLIEGTRGFVGSSATTHTDGSTVQLYRGSFNIVGTKVHFTEPPRGNPRLAKNRNDLPYPRTTFSGRVFLRQDYTTNALYDDNSDEFTGIGQTYRLTVQGVNTTGIQTGSGVVFLNDIFQTPTTLNNAGNNYELLTESGISSIRFTGITSTNGQIIISDDDINKNQLPRGGIIVSLGSTSGAGFAPLVGARVKAIVGAGGTIESVTGVGYTGTGKNVSTAYYDNTTGVVKITTTDPHELLGGDYVKLVGLGFTCPSSSGIVSYFPLTGLSNSYPIIGIVSETTFNAFVGYSTLPHIYVGMGTVFAWYNLNYGSGYRNPVSIAITDSNHSGTEASISAVVGAGGTLGFIVNDGGTGYTTSSVSVSVSEPSYENLSVIGVSRSGIGSTTDTGKNLLISLDVGAISTTGIGSTLFEVSSFKITRQGYGFKIGDVFKPVGLVTALGLSAPLKEFELTVIDTFTDSFSSWQFGELDYIDSIKNLQNSQRRRFPLYYNGQLLSFEKDPSDINSVNIDLDAVLLIFINGVIQVPGQAYEFDGGTSFVFAEPPKPEDNISIFFYRGTREVDSKEVPINETIKIGDTVQVFKNDVYPSSLTQDSRRIDNIPGSDILETNLYTGIGIDEIQYKPFSWTKQKVDRVVNGDFVYKSRDSIESQIYPTSKIIKDVGVSDTEIFVDDAKFFNYEDDNYLISIISVEGLIVQGTDPVSAAITATVSAAGTISSLTITNAGFGYTSTATVKIGAPKEVGVGIGTTATASVSISGGIVSSVSIINPGFGYTFTNPPQIIVSSPEIQVEKITNISVFQGSSGIITGITTTAGTGGNPLALKFFLNADNFTDLSVGYPILIKDSVVGSGITSIDSSDSSVVGFGTTNVDNIYIIHNLNVAGTNADFVTNIKSDTDTVGIETFGTTSSPVGKFSWGRLSGVSRGSSPVSIGVTGLTVDSGLSTFPTIQRRGFGLRNTGAIRKKI